MGSYPTAPSPYAGTSLLSQWLDPTTRYLFNQPPPDALPPPSTPAALPPANPYPGYGAASAAPPPEMMQAQHAQQAMQAMQAMPGVTPPSVHAQYQMLRSLDQLARGGGSPENAYSLLQALLENGTLYPGQGGIGLNTAMPYGGPDAARTQRLIDLYERYQDFLNAGGMPAPTMHAPSGGSYPMPRVGVIGTIPP